MFILNNSTQYNAQVAKINQIISDLVLKDQSQFGFFPFPLIQAHYLNRINQTDGVIKSGENTSSICERNPISPNYILAAHFRIRVLHITSIKLNMLVL